MRIAVKLVPFALAASLAAIHVDAAPAAESTTCTIAAPGVGSVEGTGRLTLTQNGHLTATCHADVDDEAAPERAAQRDSGPICRVVVTPSGRANSVCH